MRSSFSVYRRWCAKRMSGRRTIPYSSPGSWLTQPLKGGKRYKTCLGRIHFSGFACFITSRSFIHSKESIFWQNIHSFISQAVTRLLRKLPKEDREQVRVLLRSMQETEDEVGVPLRPLHWDATG